MVHMTKEAFSSLMRQYERLVYTICFQLVRDAAAAEDLTQETFLSAYLHRDSIPQDYERQQGKGPPAKRLEPPYSLSGNRRAVPYPLRSGAPSGRNRPPAKRRR